MSTKCVQCMKPSRIDWAFSQQQDNGPNGIKTKVQMWPWLDWNAHSYLRCGSQYPAWSVLRRGNEIAAYAGQHNEEICRQFAREQDKNWNWAADISMEASHYGTCLTDSVWPISSIAPVTITLFIIICGRIGSALFVRFRWIFSLPQLVCVGGLWLFNR